MLSAKGQAFVFCVSFFGLLFILAIPGSCVDFGYMVLIHGRIIIEHIDQIIGADQFH